MPIDLNVRQISKAKRTKAALDRLTNLYGAPKTISIYKIGRWGSGEGNPKKGKALPVSNFSGPKACKNFQPS